MARSRRAICAATLDLLGEAGYGGVTIEAVAARAGVGKSTIYRHWTGKLDLVEDAIRTLKPAPLAVGTGATARQRIVGLLTCVAGQLAGSTWSACLPAIIDAAERDPEVRAFHRRFTAERRQVLVRLLAEGVAAGEVAVGADLTLLADCLVGPIVVRRLLVHEPFDPAGIPALVDQVLDGAVARAPSRPRSAPAGGSPDPALN